MGDGVWHRTSIGYYNSSIVSIVQTPAAAVRLRDNHIVVIPDGDIHNADNHNGDICDGPA
jgi:hypothetical protein